MRKKMSGVERAKQFLPFSPLSEHALALKARERQVFEMPLLAEDAQAELDGCLRSLSAGQPIRAVYYRDGAVCQAQGAFRLADPVRRVLLLEGAEIALDSLLALSREP